MDYKGFTEEEFAKDAFFIRWVKGDQESLWFWETFCSEHPEKAEQIERARAIVELMLSVNQRDRLGKDAQESMRNRLVLQLKARKEGAKERASRKESKHFRMWMAVAAAVVLMVASVFVLTMRAPDQTPHILQTYGLNDSQPVVTDSTELRINPRGQKSVMLLEDGTKVWLNADSKLTYPTNFSTHSVREVYLEGEAFFDVVKNPEKPFIVHTSALDIRVLGTSFNVKSYADDSRIETTLVEGKVEIDKVRDPARAGRKVILEPNQKATFSKESDKIKVNDVAAAEVVAWKNDRLVFKAEPFRDVVKQLERWYNVRIHIEDSEYEACPLTASIEKESLEEILDFLAVTHKISFAISGSDVYVKGSLCK